MQNSNTTYRKRTGFWSGLREKYSPIVKSIEFLLSSLMLIYICYPAQLFAEGTYELMARSGANPVVWLESPGFGQGSAFNLNLPRRTIFKVDVLNANEVIDFYTSRFEGATNIAVWVPGRSPSSGVPDWTFDVTNGFLGPGPGYIGSFTEVQDVQNINTRPRTPATYTPSTTGVYTVVMYGQGSGTQRNGVQYFDIMVRGTNGTGSTNDDDLRRGRVWSDHLAINMDSFANEMFSEFYIVDGEDRGSFFEGYLWEGNLNGIQPFAFHMFTNRNGAFPETHHFTSVRNNATPTPQMIPQFPMYFNEPEKPVVIPTTPEVSNLVFNANCAGASPGGGEFEFDTNGNWEYEIILDENGDGTYDRSTERTLSGQATAGHNVIPWNGKLQDGSNAPNGSQITVLIRAKASEIHFPFYDVENRNTTTGPTFTLASTSSPISQLYFWNDAPVGGTSALGTGSAAPHTWGDAIGESAIVDTWKTAFESIDEFVLSYSCNAANISVNKTVNVSEPFELDQITYTLSILNRGPVGATGVSITDNLPAGVTYVSDDGSGSYNRTTGVWDVANLLVDSRDTLNIVVQVDGGTAGSTITNSMSASLDQTDPEAGNNTSSVDITVEDPGGPPPNCTELPTFSFTNPSLVSGTDNEVGAVYRFPNVRAGTDAIVTITGMNNAILQSVDQFQTAGTDAALQPVIEAANKNLAEGYVDFRIQFVEAATFTPKAFSSFSFTAIDVDGDDVDTREFVGFLAGESYTIEAVSGLTPGFDDPYNTLEASTSAVRPGIDPNDTESMVYIKYKNISTLNVRGGLKDPTNTTGGAARRLFSFDFTPCLIDNFVSPNTITIDADISVSKTIDDPFAAEGDTLAFTLDVDNLGPRLGTGIIMRDVLPVGFTFVSATPDQGSFNSANGEWSVGNLDSGTGASLTLNAKVDAGTYNTDIKNFARIVQLNQNDPNAANDTSSVTVSVRANMSGVVFEDINYGGGDGRSRSESGGAGRPNATVELYDSAGNYVTSTTTGTNGRYAFKRGLTGEDFIIRVVNRTVTSSRPGGVSSELGLQTFRMDGSSGTLQPVRDRVGGEDPQQIDAPPNSGTQTLADLNSPAGEEVQSLTAVTIPANNSVTGIDFGFNFSTVVNTNDSDQGSLRQFLANSNLLSNSGLDQDDAPNGVTAVTKDAGNEHSIFMIPNTDTGLGSTIDGGTGNAFIIDLQSSLPVITGANIVVDGRIQTAFTGNSNTAVDEITPGPEIIINANGNNGGNPVLDTQAGNTVFQSMGVTGATGAADNALGFRFQSGATNSSLINSIAWSNESSGVRTVSTDQISITGSVIRDNGSSNHVDADGIDVFNSTNVTISDNTLKGNIGYGIDLNGDGTTGDYNIQNNHIEGNGATIGGATGTNPAGIGIRNANSGTIQGNIIVNNRSDGIIVLAGTQNTITQNSIFTNGELSIDLGGLLATNGDEVTINDPDDIDTGPNELFNFPIFENAALQDDQLTITGFARPGTVIEVFIAEEDPSGFGEGMTYVATVTEGSAQDNDNTTGLYEGIINGSTQGNDLTNRFEFTITVGNDFPEGAKLTATGTDGNGNTSEFNGIAEIGGNGVELSGTVYEDANHDAMKADSEAGTGLTLFAKLIETATPGGPAVQTVSVDAGSGVYIFTDIVNGSYSIVIDDNNDPNDVSPTIPTGWVGTEIADQQRDDIAVNNAGIRNLNFGLFNGSRFAGTVFNDNGINGGTPNDGIQNGEESGLANVIVKVTDTGGSIEYHQTKTDGQGSYTLWIPAAAGANDLVVTQVNLSGYLSTGGSTGNTGGTYNRGLDALTFTNSVGSEYVGADFGDVQRNIFTQGGQQNAGPGTVVYFPHTFVAKTGGSITAITTTDEISDGAESWPKILYLDSNCNGQLDDGENPLSTPIVVTAGQQVCVLQKVTIPAGTATGTSNSLTITANFEYTNASPALEQAYSQNDIIQVADASSSGLKITKQVDKTQALPGETLTYTITYTNNSSDPLDDLEIVDSTPSYTNFDSAVCGPTPNNLTDCAVTAPAQGSGGVITWTFSGSLAPGVSGEVTYQVIIEN